MRMRSLGSSSPCPALYYVNQAVVVEGLCLKVSLVGLLLANTKLVLHGYVATHSKGKKHTQFWRQSEYNYTVPQ